MKKRILAVALAATMVLASAISAMAASTTVTNAAWWDAWTPGYEIADGATVEFDVEFTTGGPAVYQSLNAVFANVATDGVTAPGADNFDGYAEYVVLRSDNYGWGTEYAAGNVTYTGTEYLYIDDATDYAALLTGAHYDITITRDGNNLSYDYVITCADGTVLNCGYDIAATDLSAGCYVFFTGDGGTSFTIEKVEAADDGAADDGAADDGAADDGAADDGAADDGAADDGAADDAPATSTGDVATAAMIVAMVGAAAAVVVLKKRVTE